MKISELKEIYLEKSKEVARKYEEIAPNIGTRNYSVPYDGGYWGFIVKLVDDDSYWNHIKLEINDNRESYASIDEESEKYFREQFSLVKEYWSKFAQIKGKAGVLFSVETNCRDTKMLYMEMAAEGLTENETRLIRKNFNKNSLIGGVLSKEIKEKMEKFIFIEDTLKKVMEKEPLFVLTKQDTTLADLFDQYLFAKYCGVDIRFYIQENNQRLKWQYNQIERETSVNLDDVLALLGEIKSNTRLKNLVDTPRHNCATLLRRLFMANGDIIEATFSKFEEVLGSWEEVETMAVLALEQFVEEKTEILCLETTGNEEKRDLNIHKFKYRNRFCFLVSKTTYRDGLQKEIDIIVSVNEKPKEVAEITAEFLLPNYKQ